MKKLFLTGIGFFLALSLTFAQQATPEENATKVTTELTQKLSLTDEQKTAAYTITLEQAKASAALAQDTTVAPEVLTEQLAKLQGDADTKVAALLTEDQKALFVKVIEERATSTVAPVEAPKKEEEKKSEENTTEEKKSEETNNTQQQEGSSSQQ